MTERKEIIVRTAKFTHIITNGELCTKTCPHLTKKVRDDETVFFCSLFDTRLRIKKGNEIYRNGECIEGEEGVDFLRSFKQGDLYKHLRTGEVFEFGYIGNTGLAIVYTPGECNMQDSFAIDPQLLEKVNVDK